MRLQQQLYRHDPEAGEIGDCWRTCIACMLSLDLTAVPHFTLGNGYEGEWYDRTQQWLIERGFRMIAVPMDGPDLGEILAAAGGWNPGTPFILTGKKGNGVDHNVICQDGAVIWDPSLEPMPGGVSEPATGGYWWCYFIGASLL